MSILAYALAFILAAAFIAGISWAARSVRRQQNYDDLLPIDFGALESDLTSYVHADLNRMKR